MNISWNWLSELVDLSPLKGGPEELAKLLTSRGIEVEAVHRQDQGFEKVVTVRILERNKHPDADRLSVCKVTTGAGEPLEIVCGAQNMKAGDIVALAQVGADLPNGVKIKAGKIRGVTSNGMLCSEEELKLADESEGILILPASTPLGRPLAEVLGRNDTVLELSLTPNRSDCLSHIGVAREVAAALGQTVKMPEVPALEIGDAPIRTRLDAGDDAPQFWGCLMEGVKVGPSPAWLVQRLESVGARSINNVVDVTNYVLFEFGQPMHAYDADLLEGKVLSARRSKKGEQLPLLDGDEVELTGSELVIADEKKPVALAGVMGGGNSEVRDSTTRLYLECAEFNPMLVRRAARRFLKHSESSHRFERGVDPNGLPRALARMAGLIAEVAGGKIIATTVAAAADRDPKKGAPAKTVPLDPAWLNSFLGVELSEAEIKGSLESLGCKVQAAGGEWKVVVPSYRLDLSIREDLAEEIARSVGYERIPATLPPLTTIPTPLLGEPGALWLAQMDAAKDTLASEGYLEALNYAFTSRAWLEKFGLQGEVALTNPLSEELEVMVPALLPELIRNALGNWHHHFGSEPLPIRLFELRPTFHLKEKGGKVEATSQSDTGVREDWKLAIVLSGPRYASGLRQEVGEVDFFDLKATVETLFEQLGTKGVRFRPVADLRPGAEDTMTSWFHPGQSVEILAGKDRAGYLGRLHPRLAKQLKCRAPLWVAELSWSVISKMSRTAAQPREYRPWSEFPGIERDFALLVKEGVSADQIVSAALKSGKPLAKVAKVFDIYKGSQVHEGMTSVAVRVIFSEEGRSLQEEEADQASARILEAWKKDVGAELRS